MRASQALFEVAAGRSVHADGVWLPLGVRVLKNLEVIVREQLATLGAHEVSGELVAATSMVSSRVLPSAIFERRGWRFVAVGLDRDETWASSTRSRFTALAAAVCGRACLPHLAARAGAGKTVFATESTKSAEMTIAVDPPSGYAATAEVAARVARAIQSSGDRGKEDIDTGEARTVAEVAEVLEVTTREIVKTVVVVADGEAKLACIAGDRKLSLPALRDVLGAETVELADSDRVVKETGCEPGWIGPLRTDLEVIADIDLEASGALIVGAGRPRTHTRGVTVAKDVRVSIWAPIASANKGDRCPESGELYQWIKARALANIEDIGTTEELVATQISIDLEAIAHSCVERYQGARGIAWPSRLAPYAATVSVLKVTDSACASAGETLYRQLQQREIAVLLDDRAAKIKRITTDAELLGAPIRVLIGPRSIRDDAVEIHARGSEDPIAAPVGDAAEAIEDLLTEIRKKERTEWTPHST